MKELPVGLLGRAETIVTEENTAMAAGSGTLRVFGTPFMLALMEKAASESVLPYLDEGESTVGTLLHVSHDSATPVGMAVRAESELTAVEGKKLCFTVTAYDAAGPIGKGTHERFVITSERFLAKTYGKL
jgi:predicted thioesterase